MSLSLGKEKDLLQCCKMPGEKIKNPHSYRGAIPPKSILELVVEKKSQDAKRDHKNGSCKILSHDAFRTSKAGGYFD
jgi:hypothetical protein